jgi:tetratricopeptide (TPR) repeat protein
VPPGVAYGVPASFSGWKGSLLVPKARKNAVRTWFLAAVVGVGLLAGCPPRQPSVDMYLDAVMLRELGQDELAVKKLDAVVAADPDFALAYTELGKAHEALGNHEKAMVAFRRAAQLDPWSFRNHMNLAEICGKLGNYPEAAEAYARAAELDSKSVDAMIGAAQCYLEAREYAKSLVYSKRAEETGERTGEVLRFQARAFEGQQDYEQAIQTYKRLLSLGGEDADVLLPLAVAYMKAEEFAKARTVLISVTRMRSEDSVAFRHLGYCLIKLGETDEAVQMYEKSIDLNEADWETHRGLGVAYMIQARQRGDDRLRAKALDHWRRALSIAPDQPKRKVLERLIREEAGQENPLQGLNE